MEVFFEIFCFIGAVTEEKLDSVFWFVCIFVTHFAFKYW